MNKRWLLLMVAAALLLAWAGWNSVSGSDVMEYHGEKIKLSKHYTDFDEYKNDPNNIDPSENERVQRLVVRAPIERFFSNRLDLFRAAGEIAFPGYGQGSGGGIEPDGSELLAVVTEIPRAEKDRYIVFRGRHNQYELIDDFVNREIVYPLAIREENGSYVYYSRGAVEAFRRKAAGKESVP
jgi:hypothetical protein